MRILIVLILFLASAQLLAQSTVASVPNQKLITGSYVSNPDNILDAGTVMQIDTLLKSLENETTVQVAVVALASIGEEDIFDFAQKLFEHWGIGSKTNDNGLLLLLVSDQRTIRFHTGYGIEGVLTDAVCKRIQLESMVPEFKNGSYGAGILAGLQQVQRVVTDPAYAGELNQPAQDEVSDRIGFAVFLFIVYGLSVLIAFIVKATQKKFSDSRTPAPTLYPELRTKRWWWLMEFVVMPVAIVAICALADTKNPSLLLFIALYLYLMVTACHRLWRTKKVTDRLLKRREYHETYEFVRDQQAYWFFMGVVFPLPFLFYFFYHLSRKKHYRNHPRNCSQCQHAMQKLDEKSDDAFLSEGQRMEEQLRSVDYDVWKCTSCEGLESWFYPNRGSKYQPCPKCSTRAYHLVSDRILTQATYSSQGSGEQVHACKYCGHTKKSTYTIAKLVASKSSGGSSSYSGGGSSGGGSWGGGSSGGGGASSSW